MANLTEDEINRMVDRAVAEAVAKERERCVFAAGALANVWENGARKLREKGSYDTRAIWPPFKKMTFVKPRWEQAARDIEAAAGGIRRLIVRAIREGWDLDAKPDEHARADWGNVGTEAGS